MQEVAVVLVLQPAKPIDLSAARGVCARRAVGGNANVEPLDDDVVRGAELEHVAAIRGRLEAQHPAVGPLEPLTAIQLFAVRKHATQISEDGAALQHAPRPLFRLSRNRPVAPHTVSTYAVTNFTWHDTNALPPPPPWGEG